MNRWLPAVLILILPICCFGDRCETPMLPVVEEFIYKVWRIAHQDGLTSQVRQEHYGQAVGRLLKKAQEMQVDPEPLLALAKDFVEHEEWYRSPPTGWDPDDKVDNLIMFQKVAARGLQIDLGLMSYGWKDCEPR
jgi:hypothetical protein